MDHALKGLSMTTAIETILGIVKRLYQFEGELEAAFPGLPFTPRRAPHR